MKYALQVIIPQQKIAQSELIIYILQSYISKIYFH